MLAQSDRDSESTQNLLSSASLSSLPKAASYKSTLDPIAVLKRVEELRKWQEEEKLKLLKAHEDQMQQFRIEQVIYPKKKNEK